MKEREFFVRIGKNRNEKRIKLIIDHVQKLSVYYERKRPAEFIKKKTK